MHNPSAPPPPEGTGREAGPADPRNAEAGRILSVLRHRRIEVAEEMAAAVLCEVGDHTAGDDPAVAADLTLQADRVLEAFLAAAEGLAPTEDAVGQALAVPPLGPGEPLPLETLLGALRAELKTLRERILSWAGEGPAAGDAALSLAARSLEYADALGSAATSAYVQRDPGYALRARNDLLEILLAGRFALRDEVRARATALGLDGGDYVVSIATLRGPAQESDPQALRLVAGHFMRSLAEGSSSPFVAVRGGEIVSVIFFDADRPRLVREAFEGLVDELQTRQGVDLAVGISTRCRGLPQMPRGYEEARRALRRVQGRGVESLLDMPLLGYLVAQADPGARRLIPRGARRFLREDARMGGALVATLQAYLDNDLNVARTAAALTVHPNTVHYRLTKIGQLTMGRSLTLWETIDLVVATSILRSTDVIRDEGRAP